MNAPDQIRARQGEQVIVPLEQLRPVGKALATVVSLLQLLVLDHGAHGAIEQQNPLRESLAQWPFSVSGSVSGRTSGRTSGAVGGRVGSQVDSVGRHTQAVDQRVP